MLFLATATAAVLCAAKSHPRSVLLRHDAVWRNGTHSSDPHQRPVGAAYGLYWVQVDVSVLYSDAVVREVTPCTALPHRLHGHTFQCLMTPSEAVEVQRHAGITAVATVRKEHKYDPAAMAQAEYGIKALLLPSRRVRVSAVVDRLGVDKHYHVRQVGRWTIVVLDRSVHRDARRPRRAARGHVTRNLLDRVAEAPEVYWIEPHTAVRLHNTFASPFVVGVPRVDLPYTRGDAGLGELIAVADTGLDHAHCSFQQPTVARTTLTLEIGEVPDPAELVPNVKVTAYVRYIFHDNGPDVVESDFSDTESGHGTHVCASAVGADGSASRASLLMLDIGASDLGDDVLYTPHDIKLHMLDWLFQYTPSRILSISWGSDVNEYTETARQMDEFCWQHQEFVILVAAGNSGDLGRGTVGAPATAKNVISVGASFNAHAAVEQYRHDSSLWVYEHGAFPFASFDHIDTDALASFSGRGPTRDGRQKPDIVAPGSPIASARAGHGCSQMVRHGTSMSTPLVAGVVARLRAQLPGISAAFVKAALAAWSTPPTKIVSFLHEDVDDLGRVVPRVTSTQPTKNDYGHGVLHMGDAAKLVYFDRMTIQQDMVLSFLVDSAPHDFHLVLAWTDPPAPPNARRMLVNDLNLDVVVDGVTRLYGGGETLPDMRNNVEKIANIPAGSHVQIFVRAVRVDSAHKLQPFALVAAAASRGMHAPAMSGTVVSPICSATMPPEPCMMDDRSGGGTRSCEGSSWGACNLQYCADDHVWDAGICKPADDLHCYNYGGTSGACHIEHGEGLWCGLLGRCAVTRCHSGYVPHHVSCVCVDDNQCVPSSAGNVGANVVQTAAPMQEHLPTLVFVIGVAILVVACILVHESARSYSQPTHPTTDTAEAPKTFSAGTTRRRAPAAEPTVMDKQLSVPLLSHAY